MHTVASRDRRAPYITRVMSRCVCPRLYLSRAICGRATRKCETRFKLRSDIPFEVKLIFIALIISVIWRSVLIMQCEIKFANYIINIDGELTNLHVFDVKIIGI